MNRSSPRSTVPNGDDGRSTLRSPAGVLPSAIVETATAKLRMRPSLASHAAMLGCEERALTSSRTNASLWSSGGTTTGAATPPSGAGWSAFSGATVWDCDVSSLLKIMYAVAAARAISTIVTIHNRPERLGRAGGGNWSSAGCSS
jgi:hypothetical protein